MPTTDQPDIDTRSDSAVQAELAGLDALELADRARRGRAGRFWSAAWPKLAATALGLLVWQIVVWSGWKPEYALPPPTKVLPELWNMLLDGKLTTAVSITLRRAAFGFALAIVIGVAIGSVVSRVRLLRVAFGSLITGLQTMPSIAWFPLSLLLFKRSEGGDHVRRRAGRGAGDRQRAHLGRRPHPAVAAAGGPGARGADGSRSTAT